MNEDKQAVLTPEHAFSFAPVKHSRDLLSYLAYILCGDDPDEDITPFATGYSGGFSEAVLVIAAFASYIAPIEFAHTFPFSSRNLACNVIPKLLKTKCLEKAPLPSSIEGAKCCYHLTKEGYRIATSTFWGFLPQKFQTKRKATAVQHTYAIGMNFFQMLSLSIPFQWEREPVYQIGNMKGILQPDAKCTLRPAGSDQEHTLFIEQDMGLEQTWVLVRKLENYASCGLMRAENSRILFSFFDALAKADADPVFGPSSPFSVTRIDEILDLMGQMQCEDAYLIANDPSPDPLIDVYALRALLKATGATERTDGILVRGEAPEATRGFLRKYREALTEHQNPYLFAQYCKRHMALSRKRMRDMAYRLLDGRSEHAECVSYFLLGFSALCMPTAMAAKCLSETAFDLFPDNVDRFLETLRDVFHDAEYTGELSSDILLRGSPALRLRNAFHYRFQGTDGQVCVEFPDADLGAWVRAYYFANHELQAGQRINLVLVFSTEAYRRSFSRFLDYHYHSPRPDPAKNGILYVLKGGIGKAGALRTA